MIGLVARKDELPLAGEFFELFKTPWEIWRAEGVYSVLVSTTGELPEGQGTPAVVFGNGEQAWERAAGLARRNPGSASSEGAVLKVGEETLPIYGSVSFFQENGAVLARGEPGAAALVVEAAQRRVARIGYDLFPEVGLLLAKGQPVGNAASPALDLHIGLLREAILRAGAVVAEVPPVPKGARFIACLTHDVDFVYLRQHLFDHSMWGFLYRATVGSTLDFAQGRKPFSKLAANWAAALKLPLVHLGICKDFWQQFDGYLKVENGRPSTFFIIPFKDRPGKPRTSAANPKRATKYDVGDVPEWMQRLQENGCEVALHGIDAWTDQGKAKEESARIGACAGRNPIGLRMHWLYFSEESPKILDDAGFEYDSTCGYNEAVGYRAGTSQVFRPLGVERLLELPMHIQDTALFYPGRMHLREEEAWKRCERMAGRAQKHGGVLTLLWHDRSLAPERLWGEFYKKLLDHTESLGAWFATAEQTVAWFRKRRDIRFKGMQRDDASPEKIEIEFESLPEAAERDFVVRVSWLAEDGSIRTTDTALAGKEKMRVRLPGKTEAAPSGGPESAADTERRVAEAARA